MIRTGACLVALALIAGPAGAETQKMEQAKQAIRQADLDFARALKEHDRERFMSFIAPDGVFYGTRLLRGPEKVAEGWGVFLDPESGRTLVWAPDSVEVSASADLGYTRGHYELRGVDAEGKPTVAYGRYVSIWRKQPDGKWRVVVDIGTPPAAEMPAEE